MWQVNSDIISDIDDKTLSTFIPTIGDRVALKKFCKKKSTRASLFERLREKVMEKEEGKHCKRRKIENNKVSKGREKNYELSSSSEGSLIKRSQSSQANATKSNRVIELGWLVRDSDSHEYKQLRSVRGGGARKISMSKDSRKSDILAEAKKLFLSKCKDDYCSDLNILDFARNVMDESTSIGEMYDITKMTSLRFYLATTKKVEHCDSSGVRAPKRKCKSVMVSSATHDIDELLPLGLLLNEGSISQASTATVQEENVISSSSLQANLQLISNDNTFYQANAIQVNALAGCIEPELQTNFMVDDDCSMNQVSVIPLQLNSLEQHPFIALQTTCSLVEDIDALETVTQHMETNYTNPMSILPAISMQTELLQGVNAVQKVQILVRIGNAFKEIMDAFKDEFIMTHELVFKRILPNGTTEVAVDEGGVARDCITEFWESFFDHCCTGSEFRVPFLRHDFMEEEWKAIARVIFFGFTRHGYIPIKIAPTLLEIAIFGKPISSLANTFLFTLPQYQREIVQKALQKFDEIDEELIDILDEKGCRRKITKESLPEIVNEIAHKDLVQTPAFITDCWQQVLSILSDIMTPQDMNKLYTDLKPSNMKIVKILQFPETMQEQYKETASYLRRYVREELDSTSMPLFLRYCTGSDLLTAKVIRVCFVDLYGAARRPIGHTCGCVLEVPGEYESYLSFKEEFNAVLKSNIWIMDII